MKLNLACGLLAAFAASAAGLSPAEKQGLTEDRKLLRGAPTVVVFLSARCPVSNAYGERFQRIYEEYRPKGVRFFFVNSNVNESEAEITRNTLEHGFTFPIFRDLDSRAADRFGAQATPELFLLDSAAEVRYHGALDDAQNPARVHHHRLREALDQILAGTQVTIAETKSFGCTIKRPRKP